MVTLFLGYAIDRHETVTNARTLTPTLTGTVGLKLAVANRDALIKDIYGRIFDWLIHTVCNTVLKPPGDDDGFVGLLDIFGFEVFKRNSIEQLCINFANEKLQKLFNDHIFEEERKTYKSEDLDDNVIPPYVVFERGVRAWCSRVVFESGVRAWCSRISLFLFTYLSLPRIFHSQ